jgi:Putative transposase/Phage integrase, N-terminal SAM-like domain
MTNRTISPLRQRMVEDMNARQLGPHSQRSHIDSCERFASFLKRAPDTATADDVRRFQLHLMESGASIGNRNRIMTGVKFLLRVTLNQSSVTFRYKDYCIDGPGRSKTMTLPTHEFIRRFLMHVLPKGFHRIRHYGLFANGNRAANLARARELLQVAPPATVSATVETGAASEPRVEPCPCCGGRMLAIETFERGCEPKHRPQRAPPLGPRDIS